MARLTDLTFEGDKIWFSWIPSHEDEFEEDLAEMKRELAACGRRWSPDRKQWSVSNNDESVGTITLFFTNGKEMVRNVRNQMDLFTRE